MKEKYDSYVKGYKLVKGQPKVIQPYIIKFDSKPIGYIQTYNIHDYHDLPELKSFPNPLPAIDIYIGDTDYLHKGIGKKTLELFALEYASKIGDVIFVAADIQNNAALKMYHACGFKEIKRIDNEIWMLKY